MKRVLHVPGSLRLGGLETVAVNYLKYSDSTQFHFTYLVYGDKVGELEKKVVELGGKIVRIASPGKDWKRFVADVRRTIREYGPFDIVHSHPAFNSGLVMRAAYLESIPKRITHSHTNRSNLKISLIKSIYNASMRLLIKKYATDFIACSGVAGAYLFGKDFFLKKGTVIINAIDTNKFVFNEETRMKNRKELGLHNSFVLGHTGTLNEVKNQSFIIDVLKKMVIEKKNVKLLLIGEGPEKVSLINKVNSLNLKENVAFLGSQSNINELLMTMDLFVFPSLFEGLGISLIEAQAIGIPCVVSEAIPREAIINENVTKLPLDLKMWTNEIKSSLEKKTDIINKVQATYNIEIMMDQVRNLYK